MVNPTTLDQVVKRATSSPAERPGRVRLGMDPVQADYVARLIRELDRQAGYIQESEADPPDDPPPALCGCAARCPVPPGWHDLFGQYQRMRAARRILTQAS